MPINVDWNKSIPQSLLMSGIGLSRLGQAGNTRHFRLAWALVLRVKLMMSPIQSILGRARKYISNFFFDQWQPSRASSDILKYGNADKGFVSSTRQYFPSAFSIVRWHSERYYVAAASTKSSSDDVNGGKWQRSRDPHQLSRDHQRTQHLESGHQDSGQTLPIASSWLYTAATTTTTRGRSLQRHKVDDFTRRE